MSKIKVILSVTFALLLVVIIAELVYLFVLSPNRTKSNDLLNGPVNKEQGQNTTNARLAGTGDTKSSESKLETVGQQGTIKEIDKSGGYLDKEKMNYDVKLVLSNSKNNDFFFYFTNEELRSAKVISVENGKETNISFDDLKPGDRVMVQAVIDTSKPANSNALEITISVLK